MAGGRFRELLKKYGKVALGVHFSVSAVSITGIYFAVNNNVDVESLLEKVGVRAPIKQNEQPKASHPQQLPQSDAPMTGGFVFEEPAPPNQEIPALPNIRNRTAELAASSGGALAVAVLLNKALLPVRIPITIALTPPVARFLARRRINKNSV